MRRRAALLICLLVAAGVSAQTGNTANDGRATEALQIAVATNFGQTFESLSARYREETGEQLRVSSASTGVLYTQIRHGAPFDVLLAADSERPARLVSDGSALPDTRMTYAIGRLVIAYSENLHNQAKSGIEGLLSVPDLSLAMANPELAPYGRAARSVLQRFPNASPRVLTGQNVGQAVQMWVAGGADLALVAASYGVSPSLRIPQDWHDPIEQQAVVLSNSTQQERASQFLHWMSGPSAREIILRDQYGLPGVSHD